MAAAKLRLHDEPDLRILREKRLGHIIVRELRSVYGEAAAAGLLSVRVLDHDVKLPSAEIFLNFQVVPGCRDRRRETEAAKVGTYAQNAFHAAHHNGGSGTGQPVDVGTARMHARLSFRELPVAVGLYAADLRPVVLHGGSVLAEISKGYEGTGADKAIKNALATTPINTLAINSENAAMIDTHFSDRVKTKGHTDQKSSGRCWLFTGLNVLRAKMITQHDLGSFTFSQNYVFFYDQLEKANLFLQGIIDTRKLPDDDREVDWLFSNPIGDGGQFTGVSNLITKYGVVPSEVMPETFCANNTAQMRTQIATKLREDGLRLRQAYKKAMTIPDGKRYQKGNLKMERKDAAALENLEKMKIEQLKEIYHILALCLGVPPTEFEWTRYNSKGEFVSTKTYTPKSFYDEFVGADQDL